MYTHTQKFVSYDLLGVGISLKLLFIATLSRSCSFFARLPWIRFVVHILLQRRLRLYMWRILFNVKDNAYRRSTSRGGARCYY